MNVILQSLKKFTQYFIPSSDVVVCRSHGKAIGILLELLRVLKPGGVIGVCSPDWDGFILSPPSNSLTSAIAAYTNLQSHNGGDVNVGRKLGTHLAAAGFDNCRMSARYEVYPDRKIIGEYLAVQLERAGDNTSAGTFRTWSYQTGGLFAQCWVACVAEKPKQAGIRT